MSAHAKIPALWSKKEQSDPKHHLGHSSMEPFLSMLSLLDQGSI